LQSPALPLGYPAIAGGISASTAPSCQTRESGIDQRYPNPVFFRVTGAAASHRNNLIFMDPMLLQKARETVGNDKILVNLVSRRVRQLNATSRPLVEVDPGMGFIDIALKEIGEGKITARAATVTAEAA
jgi:DNA-directed RNA polymerase subunit omega